VFFYFAKLIDIAPLPGFFGELLSLNQEPGHKNSIKKLIARIPESRGLDPVYRSVAPMPVASLQSRHNYLS